MFKMQNHSRGVSLKVIFGSCKCKARRVISTIFVRAQFFQFVQLIFFVSILTFFNRESIVNISGGLNHLPYLLSTSVSLAVIKDFLTNYMTALGLNQAYTSLKLRNKYDIVLICSFR